MNISSVTSSAVKGLRVKALLAEVPKTAIARKLGVNRATVAKTLKGNDIKLSAFVQTAQMVGADPVQLLAEAMNESNTVPADQEPKQLAA